MIVEGYLALDASMHLRKHQDRRLIPRTGHHKMWKVLVQVGEGNLDMLSGQVAVALLLHNVQCNIAAELLRTSPIGYDRRRKSRQRDSVQNSLQ